MRNKGLPGRCGGCPAGDGVEGVGVFHGEEFGEVEEEVEKHFALATATELDEGNRDVLVNVGHLLHDIGEADKVLLVKARGGSLALGLLFVKVLNVVG